jgi:hypothetical protein
MDARERNALEKASLDDPFLADALEGYATEGVNIKDDIAELQARLEKRTEEKKAVPINRPGNKFYSLRVAAILIMLFGAGWFIYQYGFNNKKNEIAQLKEKSKPADTITNDQVPAPGTTSTNNNFSDSVPAKKGTVSAARDNPVIVKENKTKQADTVGTINADQLKAASAPGEKEIADKALAQEKQKADEKKSSEIKDLKENEVVITAMGQKRRAKEVGYAPAARGAYERDEQQNNFRGQVRSNNNEAVPFANVTVLNNRSSTYSDANGYFSLNAKDSIISVEVKSVGYESNRAILRNNANTDIILNPEKNAMAEVVVTGYNKKADDEEMEDARKYDAEPVDGWEKYNAYLLNNIKLPPVFIKNGRNLVELSFDVNKKGRPVNISVDTSLNKDCDHEAIRLLKEGPLWKKGSGKLKVYFQ